MTLALRNTCVILLCVSAFSMEALGQDQKLPATAGHAENHTALREQLVVLEMLAKSLLNEAYFSTFHVKAASISNRHMGIRERVPNQILAIELTNVLAEINRISSLLAPDSDLEAALNHAASHGLENIVAKLNPQSPKERADVIPLAQDSKFPWPIKGHAFSAPGGAFREGGAKWPGILIKANDGTDVRSIAAGKVVYAGEMKNLGLLVIIDHEDGHISLYGRNSKILVSQNERIEKHQKISSIANVANYNNIGLYFEIRRNGKPVDPRLLCADASELN